MAEAEAAKRTKRRRPKPWQRLLVDLPMTAAAATVPHGLIPLQHNATESPTVFSGCGKFQVRYRKGRMWKFLKDLARWEGRQLVLQQLAVTAGLQLVVRAQPLCRHRLPSA